MCPLTATSHSHNRFMNCRVKGNQAYVPTDIEHLANVITHGIWIPLSLVGSIFLTQQATNRHQYLTAAIYGVALSALFLISTVFHIVFYWGKYSGLKDFLHRCDRAVIYLFIAASYTPWLTLKDMGSGWWSEQLRWMVWLFACLGIIYQQLYHERYKWLETCFYILLGVTPAIAVIHMPERSGLHELATGGAVYILGVVFFKSDGVIPCAHAIWHMFVGIGATCHYVAVFTHLMGNQNEMHS